jgi:hypothetical protein
MVLPLLFIFILPCVLALLAIAIYEICDPGGGIDVNQELDRQSPFPGQQEVVFTTIPRKFIIKATSYNRNQKQGESYINPYYDID